MTNEILVQRIAAGEDDLIEELWTQVSAFVRQQASRFYFAYHDRCQGMLIDQDDLIQVGYFALIKSIEKYQPERGTKFLTAFGYYLKTQFFTLAKMHYTGWRKNTVNACSHLEDRLGSENETRLADIIADDDDELAAIEEEMYQAAVQQVVTKALNDLTQRQLEVITSIYYEGETFEDTAKRYNISKGAVSSIRRASFQKLRRDAGVRAAWAC